MLDQLRLPWKLVALCALFLPPVGLSISRLAIGIGDEIAFSRKEIAGLAQLRPAWEQLAQGPTAGGADSVLAAIIEIEDRSNLSLDIELDSYYLQALLARDLPKWLLAGPAERQGAGAAVDGDVERALRANKDGSVAGLMEDLARLHRSAGAVDPADRRAAADSLWSAAADRLDRLLHRRLRRLGGILARDLALTLAALALSTLLALLIARSLSRPLTRLGEVMQRLMHGDFTVEVPFGERRDEIGAMAAAVRVFRDHGRQLEQLQRDRLDAERRHAAEMRESREELQLILDTTAEAIYGTDLDGRCIFCNRACLALLGYDDADQLLGRDMHSLMHHSQADGSPAPAEHCRIIAVARGEPPVHADDEVFWRRDGTCFPVEYRSYPTCRDGVRVGAVVTFLDISARKRTEAELAAYRQELEQRVAERTRELSQALLRAEAAAQAKSDFLANVSHEIRTPMNAVLGMTDLVLRGQLAPKQREFLQRSRGAAHSLLRIIDDILDFSKVEAGKLDLEQRSFQLDEVLAKVSAVVLHKIQEKGLGLEIRASPDLPGQLIGDPLRLGQILINLVNNAVKFTERGAIVVDIDALPPVDPDQAILRFTVRDTGIGISPDQIGLLFRPFAQADSSLSRKYGGTGLGLAISKQLVELMGGEIGVDSRLGVGSAFHFTARFAIDRRPPQPPAGEGADAPDIAGLRVLLVEDNVINQMLAMELLGDVAGAKVTLAENGEVAIAALAEQPFDVILMDVQMPVMDGFETTRRIRGDPRFAAIPIIAMTAHAMSRDRDECLDAGMNDYIAKPFDPDLLFATLAKWQRRQNSRSE